MARVGRSKLAALAACGLLLLGLVAAGGQVVIVPAGANWKYLDTAVDQGTQWIARTFDDSTWPQGPAPLGFGDPGMGSVLNGGPSGSRTPTVYFRRPFVVADPGLFTNLILRVRRDDGVVVYLNETEVWRSNMPPGPVAFGTLSSGFVVSGFEESAVFQTNISSALGLLSSGSNWLAAEVHQFETNSSDLVFDLELRGNDPVTNIPPVLVLDPTPRNGAFYRTGADVYFELNAGFLFDPDGAVTNVEFFANGVRVAQSTGLAVPPSNRDVKWTAVWHGATNGAYRISAIAQDDRGAASDSSNSVSITVTSLPPLTVTITNPVTATILLATASIPVRVTTSFPDAIRQVEFVADGVSYAIDSVVPYAANTPVLAVGWHTLTAVATDHSRSSVTSAPVSLQVVGVPVTTSLVATGSVWRYLDDGVDQSPNNWTVLQFDDANWFTGPARFGTNASHATPIQLRQTVYFRQKFNLPGALGATGLAFRVLRDDGCVAYLNGVEAFRMNMPNGPVSFSTPSSAVTGSTSTYFTTNVSTARLIPGENVLAVELHQFTSGTTAAFDLGLNAVSSPNGVLRVELNLGRVLLNWAGTNYLLEASSTPGGVFSVLPGATNGYSEPAALSQRFFRLHSP